jgi:hypothetical protein
MTNNAKPLAKATSTWKRSKPKVRFQSAGRRDSLNPNQASTSEAKSVSM